MARKSTSSSAAAANGQPPTPSDAGDSSRPNDDMDSRKSLKEALTSSVDLDEMEPTDPTRGKPMPCDPSLYPGGGRSLAAIGEQGFFLGFTFSASLTALAYCLLLSDPAHPLWRLAAFTTSLSIFHFLEYETTARHNLPATRSGSYLLFTNGMAYNIAYLLAITEILISHFFFPAYQNAWTTPYSILAGLGLVLLGQVVRSTAMIQAGTNFNHVPQSTRQAGHELVTHGVYGWLRHPSYFGFFWWAVGTQLLVGNKACVAGYVFVLWNFFNDRIHVEEKKLVEFFGTKYEEFRARTPTGIPFIK